MKGKLFPVVVVCLFLALAIKAQTGISVSEERSSVRFEEKTADVSLVVKNDANVFDGRITLELLDEDTKIRTQISQLHLIKKGENTYKISLSLNDFIKTDDENLAWYRLRYQVGDASGLVSLSELFEDVFKIRVIATDNLFSGMTYRTRIRATNPYNEKPVGNVKINADIELDLKSETDEKLKLTANGETDAEGFAVLDFQIPATAELDDDGEIKITGRKGGIIREATEDLNTVGNDFSFLMMTDKPLYQPEQTLNLRGILLKGSEGKTVASGEEIEFRIEGEDETVLYQDTLKTSEFGIASFSWTIPANAKLGAYSIRVRRDGEQIGFQNVKISRYDLPNFAVSAKPDKSFYLPNENRAEIEIRADYLFGKPVTKGKVRVVEETSREWNWKEQKYDVDEGEVREGETDTEGKFVARFDLSKAHEDLKDDEWRKFRDINFAAYYTDPTTNKTEQKRFDVRVTKEAIHVYYIGASSDQNPDFPVDAFVSTFYADGSPAVCDVEIKGSEADEGKFKTLQRTKTNSFGAGKLDFKRPKYEDKDTNLDLKIIARDRNGKTGTFENEIYFDDDENVLKIKTDKSIYKPGESVNVKINSSVKTGLVYIDVVKGWSVIDSFFIDLDGGKAEIKIPFRNDFQGEIKIAAFYENENEKITSASRGIIFPSPQNLKLDAEFEKAVYKPGEEASVSFSVLDNIGNAVESALGVVIFDRAVEERAKTDNDFGGMFGNFSGWLGYGDSFGGVNVKDLNELDLTKPIPGELQLVADVILYDSYYQPNIFHSRNYETDAKSVYAEFFKKQFAPVEKVLNETYKNQNFRHATEITELNKILAENKLNPETLRDPWQQNYRAVFDTVKTEDVVKIVSAGADKKFDTTDDFTVSSSGFTYFTPFGQRIDEAIKSYHERTGLFIRDEKTLFAELGISELSDRFGRPYRFDFDVAGKNYILKIHSLGKDGLYAENYWQGDDFDVWKNETNYFRETETKINSALLKLNGVPADETEFLEILSNAGIGFVKILDGYNRKIYLTKQKFSRFSDKVTVENVAKYGEEKTTEKTTITPVTQEVLQFTLRSAGKDGKENTYDDFTLALFQFVISEQAKDDAKPQIKKTAFKLNGTGSVSGTLTDATGAIVPSATVTATNENSDQSRSATSDDNGKYLIANLAAGSYSVRAQAAGFKDTIRTSVPVKANTITKVDFTLEAADVSSVVEVTAEGDTVNATSSATSVTTEQVSSLPINGRRVSNLLALRPGITAGKTDADEKSTPRLREYFPETLLWSPEVITDKNGRAQLKFKMADSITTWKLYTIASTKNGKIGVAEKDVQAFQNFFVDLDPPKFLTDGDEIFLPTQIRNYTDKKQKVDVSMTKANWFDFLDSENRQIEVESGASENAVFGFKANAVVKDGKQRVTAIAASDSDAIEKPVTVKPNGQEIVKTESKLFGNAANFEINFPLNILPKTQNAELKIYPNLFSHVSESVEGLLERPYGCGEQTISSTYPNLMILKFVKDDNKLRQTAQKYLQKGYERLLGYQVSDGGISYWGGKSEADIALTAYAIRFLNDAKEFIAVDEPAVEKAQNWLISQQRTDGSWTKKYYYETTEDAKRTKLFTAYVARSLAMQKAENGAKNQNLETALQKSLAYLKTQNAGIDEPYTLALFGLASSDAGNFKDAKLTAEKLETMAIVEGETAYWKLETNTPFYGWGTPGRIETTALVLQLLIKTKDQSPKTEDLISKGTMFLLKNKDRYGVWHSTQTTINVLDAFLAIMAKDKSPAVSPNEIQVLLNGEIIQSFLISPDRIAPVTIELKEKLNASANNLEIKSAVNSTVMAQIVQTHYIDWRDADLDGGNPRVSKGVNTTQSRQLRLDYKCDSQTAKIMQEISCNVETERIGFKGYGMLLAEIGIPPGADVSRESLQAAMDADWSLSRYDVLPDRIILYMWSKAGGTKFNFKFRPRYGINAQTPASVVYDYYNDEAKATVAPLRFEIK